MGSKIRSNTWHTTSLHGAHQKYSTSYTKRTIITSFCTTTGRSGFHTVYERPRWIYRQLVSNGTRTTLTIL